MPLLVFVLAVIASRCALGPLNPAAAWTLSAFLCVVARRLECRRLDLPLLLVPPCLMDPLLLLAAIEEGPPRTIRDRTSHRP